MSSKRLGQSATRKKNNAKTQRQRQGDVLRQPPCRTIYRARAGTRSGGFSGSNLDSAVPPLLTDGPTLGNRDGAGRDNRAAVIQEPRQRSRTVASAKPRPRARRLKTRALSRHDCHDPHARHHDPARNGTREGGSKCSPIFKGLQLFRNVTDQGFETWPIEGSTGASDRPSQGRSTVLANEASDPCVQAIRRACSRLDESA